MILLSRLCPAASAQTAVEALRYSLLNYEGTARYEALGGAFNALGGDLSSTLINPAAGSIYKASHFELTMGVHTPQTTASFGDNSVNEQASNFYITGVGFITRCEDVFDTPQWDDLTWTIAYSRTNDLNRNQLIAGDVGVTWAKYFADLAQGTHYGDLTINHWLDAELAWHTYLIDTLGAPDYYIPLVEDPGGLAQERLQSSGGQSELNFSLSSTYADQLHIGFGIGIPLIHYTEERRYDETGLDQTTNTITGWNYSQYLESTGAGYNFKIGLIYRPVHWLRLAAAYHSPSWYSMEDLYSAEMLTNLSTGEQLIRESPEGSFEYDLRTPQRVHLGGAIVIAPIGLISVDYESVNYANARFKAPDYSYDFTNFEIAQSYQNMGIWRFGGEVRFKNLYFRCGYQLWGTPIADNSPFNFKRTVVSGGIGFRNEQFQADLTVSTTQTNSDRQLFNAGNASPRALVMLNRNDQRIVFTFGFPF